MIEFDCHAHVFEQVSAIAGARYVPVAAAPLQTWLGHLERHHLKGGVIVQVSFLGADNSELCRALQQLDPRHFAGVAVVALDVSDAELDRLLAIGVRGLRWNLVRGADIPDLKSRVVRSFLKRLNARDMHLEVHLESPRLAKIIGPLLAFGGTVVVDHYGLPSDPNPQRDPWLQAIARIEDLSGLYVKFSGAYRSAFDTDPHARALSDRLPADRVLWGSDWPHTQHETEVNYDEVAAARSNLGIETDGDAVRRLYGFGAT